MTPRFGTTAPSAAALRMRRSRERRRQGDVIVSLEVGPNMTADLVDLGWLPAPDHGDKNAVTRALIKLFERAIQAQVTQSTGLEQICFLCEIKRSTIETLVELGWLKARQSRGDQDCFPTFRRPVP